MESAQAPTPEPRPATGMTAAAPVPGLALPALPPLSFGKSPEPSPLLAAWPRSAQIATAFLLGVAVTLLVVHCLSSAHSSTRPTDLERQGEVAYRVDLNEGPVEELRQLPGVGPKLAARLAKYRRTHGPFRSIEELRRVPGFGPALVERLRGRVTVGPPAPRLAPPPPPAAAAGAPKKWVAVGKKEAALQGVRIDINRATAKELQRLPRIGPKLSQRMVDERAKGLFKTVDELRRVSGIGAKTLERLRPYVTVGGGPGAPDKQP